jgi:hypothetical protein
MINLPYGRPFFLATSGLASGALLLSGNRHGKRGRVGSVPRKASPESGHSFVVC